MSEFMEWIAEHSFIEVSVVMVVILLTQLLKWPIKAAAEKYEKRTGISKSRITWVISFLPLILCAIYSIIANGFTNHWDSNSMSWPLIIKETVILSGTAIGLYEVVKKVIEAAISKEVAVKSGNLKGESEFVTLQEVNKPKK